MALCLAVLCLCCAGGLLQAKSVQVAQLEAEISQLNKQAEYESSLKKVLDFLNAPAIPDEDAYCGNLCLANTYKYISDYDNVLLYLDDVTCQKAFALFGAMQDEAKMQQAYRQAFRCADSCQISSPGPCSM